MVKKVGGEEGEGGVEGEGPCSFGFRQSVHTALISRISIQKSKRKNRIIMSQLLHVLGMMTSKTVGMMVGDGVLRVGCTVGTTLGLREGCMLGCPLGCEG